MADLSISIVLVVQADLVALAVLRQIVPETQAPVVLVVREKQLVPEIPVRVDLLRLMSQQDLSVHRKNVHPMNVRQQDQTKALVHLHLLAEDQLTQTIRVVEEVQRKKLKKVVLQAQQEKDNLKIPDTNKKRLIPIQNQSLFI
ncbi:hypothetical protein KL86DYS2_12853 [uncultured Dysgonomonas sp.]|uniref:Uncharacterized protein n=1 Tax=uncultured Dysgonomonas sp. TaxID=206096 RepID=A0A212K2B0_9BACT|nr:hypothetical protein KL86DYS2_12853 [uncultured Dysgonomonas sp.]